MLTCLVCVCVCVLWVWVWVGVLFRRGCGTFSLRLQPSLSTPSQGEWVGEGDTFALLKLNIAYVLTVLLLLLLLLCSSVPHHTTKPLPATAATTTTPIFLNKTLRRYLLLLLLLLRLLLYSYKFRPAADNPYLPVGMDDEDEDDGLVRGVGYAVVVAEFVVFFYFCTPRRIEACLSPRMVMCLHVLHNHMLGRGSCYKLMCGICC